MPKNKKDGSTPPPLHNRKITEVNFNPLENILNRLEKVRKGSSAGRWMACCPAHDDRSASLSIREKDDGVILIKCHALCSSMEILRALGLELKDLYPSALTTSGKKSDKRPFNSTEALRCISREAMIVFCAAKKLANGEALLKADIERLLVAIERTNDALTACGINNAKDK